MTDVNFKRRQFLSMRGKKEIMPLRPPWALAEALFQDLCTRCGDCLMACPENVLEREGLNGFPMVDFKKGECSFCQKCVDACPTKALNISQSPPWFAKASIGGLCLTQQDVICTTCAEQCEQQAIHFTPALRKVSKPELNIDACTGCGACVAPCPSQAIEVHDG